MVHILKIILSKKMQLTETKKLFTCASQNARTKSQKEQFLAAYQELENAYPNNFLLQNVVDSAFDGLDNKITIVAAFHQAATHIAGRIDNGEDGTNNNEYHNRLHFAKVVINVRAIAAIHNNWVDRGIIKNQPRLTDKDIAKLIFAATMHDLGHDGTGNIVKGVAIPFRLEQVAIDMAKQWANTSRSDLIEEAAELVRATDVFGNPSAASIVRAWHDYHFRGKRKPAMQPAWRQTLVTVQNTLLASIMQDADVFASVFNDSQQLKESARFATEQNATLSPKSELYFFKNILHRRMTTCVGRTYGDPFIKRRAAESRAAIQQAPLP
jgi:hypothetical protein